MDEGYKQCPYCGESIKMGAKKCRYCGEFLEGAKPTDAPKAVDASTTQPALEPAPEVNREPTVPVPAAPTPATQKATPSSNYEIQAQTDKKSLKRFKMLSIILGAAVVLIVVIFSILLSSANKDVNRMWEENRKLGIELFDIGQIQKIFITDIEIKNGDQDFGEKIYSRNTTYLYPRFKCLSLDGRVSTTLEVRVYKPSGLSIGDSSKGGYSFSQQVTIDPNGWTELQGWGNTDRGHWRAGEYRYEIWHDGRCLGAKSFTIY